MPPQDDQQTRESADRIARLLLDENREVLQAAKEALKRRLMRSAMQMALEELGDPEQIAEQVYQRLGDKRQAVVEAGQLLQDRLLDEVASRSLEPLTDPGEAASRAMERVNRGDERIKSSEDAMKELLLKQVLTDVLQEIDEEIGHEPEDLDEPEQTDEDDLPTLSVSESPSIAPAPAIEPTPKTTTLPIDTSSLADAPLDERRTWVNRVSYADAAVTQLREPDEQRERDYFYTYGVVGEAIPSEVLKGTGIQPERPPFLIPCGTVQAVVSKLEGLPFHSAERDAAIREPARKREYKREHIRVLEAIASAGYTVVPRPYGTIAASEDKIMRTVTAQSASFEAALERLKGRREWSVQLFKTQATAAETPRPAGLYASGDSYARIYDAGLEAGPQGDEENEESGLVAVIKRSIYNALLAVASDATMNATYGARTEKGLMVLNAAYLVDVEHEDTFLETAARLNERQKSLGFALVCSGPRVPLSFWQ